MNPVAWLIGLALPACGYPGAEGLPPPVPMDVVRIERPASPNTALAAPAGFSPQADIATPVYPVPAERLFVMMKDVAAAELRTFQAALYPDRLQAHYVARSAVFNFPDLILVQVQPAGPDNSTLIVYSRSVYGHSDLGVNRKWLDIWLADLRSKLTSNPER